MKSITHLLVLVVAYLAIFTAVIKASPIAEDYPACTSCKTKGVNCNVTLFDDITKLIESTQVTKGTTQVPKTRSFVTPVQLAKTTSLSAIFTYANPLTSAAPFGVIKSNYQDTLLLSITYKGHGRVAASSMDYLVTAGQTCSTTFVGDNIPDSIDYVTASTNDH